jgi:hypothetical protein
MVCRFESLSRDTQLSVFFFHGEEYLRRIPMTAALGSILLRFVRHEKLFLVPCYACVINNQPASFNTTKLHFQSFAWISCKSPNIPVYQIP